MSWYELTLLSALAIAAADSVLKKYLTGLSAWDLLLVRFTLPGALLLPYALQYPLSPLDATFMGLMALLVALEIAAMLLYVHAITTSPLHLTLPFLSFTPVINILTAYIFLGEQVNAHGAIGIIIVVIGSYILNIPPGFTLKRIAEPLMAIWQCHGSRLMLLCACIYSLTSVLSKKAMAFSQPQSFGAYYFVFIGIVVLLIYPFVPRTSVQSIAKRAFPAFTVAVLMAVMVVAHFLAIFKVEVAYMVAVKRSSMLFGILFGALFFKEGRLLRNLAAGSIMLLGIFMLLVIR